MSQTTELTWSDFLPAAQKLIDLIDDPEISQHVIAEWNRAYHLRVRGQGGTPMSAIAAACWAAVMAHLTEGQPVSFNHELATAAMCAHRADSN